MFDGSERLVVLLRFTVEETLRGAEENLKEAAIGHALYRRNPPYDPKVDSTVRVEARRLRRKLKEYYATVGSRDRVVIDLPTGGYVPTFALNASAPSAEPGGPPTIFEDGPGASIAVLPFRALSMMHGDESFADELTDEVMFAVGKARGLRIVSRSLLLQYKHRVPHVVELADELGVDAILQGTVRHDGEMLRVTLEASDRRGFVVWTDRFDARDHERMQLQERIAATTLSRIRFDSSAMRAARIRPGPKALEAHAKVYRARRLLDQQSPTAIREAIEIFSEVNAMASDYARGHTGLADAHCDLFRLGASTREEALAEARRETALALAVDPKSVEAHTAQATIAGWLEWNAPRAEEHFRQALAIGENARASRLYGVLLTMQGRHAEADRRFRDARASEPFSIQQDIAETLGHYIARRFDTCAVPSSAEERNRVVEVLFYVSLSRFFRGDHRAAEELLPDVERGAEDRRDLGTAAVELRAWLGDRVLAEQVLDGNPSVTSFACATLAAAVGDDARCLDALEHTVEQRDFSAVWLQHDARFDRIRNSARFERLLKRVRPFQS